MLIFFFFTAVTESFKLCNQKRGGGVLLLINNKISSCSVDLSDYSNILPVNVDITCAKIVLNNSSLYIFVVYIPPSLDLISYESVYDQPVPKG